MKTLYIVRHGKSSWKDLDLTDMERPLKQRGVKNVTTLGKILSKDRLKPNQILTSPAKRALDTAEIVHQCLHLKKAQFVVNSDLYDCDFAALYRLVTELDDDLKRIMIVGHEPTLSSFVNHFLQNPLEKLVTASLTTMKFGVGSWREITPTETISVYHQNRHDWKGYLLE